MRLFKFPVHLPLYKLPPKLLKKGFSHWGKINPRNFPPSSYLFLITFLLSFNGWPQKSYTLRCNNAPHLPLHRVHSPKNTRWSSLLNNRNEILHELQMAQTTRERAIISHQKETNFGGGLTLPRGVGGIGINNLTITMLLD